MKEKKKLGLGVWIMIGLAAGIAFGAILWAAMGAEAATDFTASYLKPFGDIFVNLLKFIVVPLVLLSIMDGMFSMGDIGKVGKIGWKTVVYFLATTAVACVIGLVVANLFKGSFPVLSLAEDAAYEAKESDIMTTIKNIFPSNSVQPMIDASMLQIIVIALLFGCGVLVAGEKGKPFATFISSFNEVTQTVMSFILRVSPIGVFCLMSWVVAAQGPKILGSLGLVLLAAYIGYIIHTVLVYSLSVKVFAGMSPLKFFKKAFPAMIFAFTSTSSAATLPVSKECADALGAEDDISSFVLPLGATVNMDAVSILMSFMIMFFANACGINVSISMMVIILLANVLLSVGTPGIPGGAIASFAALATMAGLPAGVMGVYISINTLCDMGATCVNVIGDMAGCVVLQEKIKLEEN